MTIGLILSLIGGAAALIFVLIIISKLKRAKIDRSENKTLKRYQKKIVKTEIQKKEIREKHDEKANDIINDPGNSNHVLQNGKSTKHNHSIRNQCGKDCPAYNK